MKQLNLPGMSINSSLQKINDGINTPVKRYKSRKCCLTCRYCCHVIYGTNCICSFSSELTSTDSLCGDHERRNADGSCNVYPSDDVIKRLTLEYQAGFAQFIGRLQEIAENSGCLMGEYKEVKG